MDVAGNNAGTDSPGDFMGDDEPQVGYRREWVPPVKERTTMQSTVTVMRQQKLYLI